MSLLYERIRERRRELGYSQEYLAKKLGYKSRSSINKIEKGLADIPQSKIQKFADALHTTPAYLMGWNNVDPGAENQPGVHDVYIYEPAEDEQEAVQQVMEFLQQEYGPQDGKAPSPISKEQAWELYQRLGYARAPGQQSTAGSSAVSQQALKLAQAFEEIGISVYDLTDADMRKIAAMAKIALNK